MARDINRTLRGLKDSWEQTEAKEGGGRIPDNDYCADIDSMELAFSNSGRLQVCSIFKIYEGDHKDSQVRRYDGLDNDTSMGYFKGYCQQIGLDAPEDIEDLPDALKEFVDSNEDKFEITVKTVNDFQNVYVTGVSDNDGSGDGGDGEVDLDDMDKDELLDYIKDNDIKIKGAKKLSEKKLRAAIEEAVEEANKDAGGSGDVDLEDMDKDELIAFAKEKGYKIKGIKKLEEDEVREAIEEVIKEEEGVDLDELDEDELIAFAKDNGLKIKGLKKMDEEDMRTAIQEAIEDE